MRSTLARKRALLPEITVEVRDRLRKVAGRGRGQRPGHCREPDRAHFRQAALWLEISQAQPVARPAGNGDLGGGNVWPADRRQAAAHHQPRRGRRAGVRSFTSRSTRRITGRTFTRRNASNGTALTARGSRWRWRAVNQKRAAFGRSLSEADRHRQSACVDHLQGPPRARRFFSPAASKSCRPGQRKSSRILAASNLAGSSRC